MPRLQINSKRTRSLGEYYISGNRNRKISRNIGNSIGILTPFIAIPANKITKLGNGVYTESREGENDKGVFVSLSASQFVWLTLFPQITPTKPHCLIPTTFSASRFVQWSHGVTKSRFVLQITAVVELESLNFFTKITAPPPTTSGTS